MGHPAPGRVRRRAPARHERPRRGRAGEGAAFALPAQEGIDPWLLLHWNRQTRFVRMACARSGDIWVHGDLPVAAIDERAVDRLLGLVVEGAVAVRGYAATATAPPA